MTDMSRRALLQKGGASGAALFLGPRNVWADDVLDIAMGGERGAHVWFNPIGLLVSPGQRLRWINHDQSNSHTATAYHPEIDGRARRIPEGAEPWDSGYLLPGESFSLSLEHEGVYDYYCAPHERAGMVGRIIVGRPGPDDWLADPASVEGVPDAALTAFPSVDDILAAGRVEAERS